MKQRVLVTGGTGFLGRAVIPNLTAMGYEVHAVTHGTEIHETDIIWHKIDLLNCTHARNLIEIVKPDALVALAWHMAPGNAIAAENFDWIAPSIALIKAFSEAGGRRALMCGSCAEYDWAEPAPFSESGTPLNPASAYGAAKHSLFKEFTTLCELSGLSGVWARPFFMYGPGEARHRLAADVITALLQGRPALCSSGIQLRDYLHVADVASAISMLLDSDVNGPVNIGSGKAIAIKDLVLEIATQIGAANLVKLGERETPENDPDIIEADINRLQTSTGWAPRFDLKNGIADTIEWWRNELDNNRKVPANGR